MSTLLSQWSAAIAGAINASAAVASSITGHSDLLGDAREVLVRDVLARLLPANTVVGKGQIIDAFGGSSHQIDVIVYRNDFPVFRTLGASDVFLLEGVLAACEVKSTLKQDTLCQALGNVASVKRLHPRIGEAATDALCRRVIGKPYAELDSMQQDSLAYHLLPACYVYGFKGYRDTFEAFVKPLTDWISAHEGVGFLPDVICAERNVAVLNARIPFSFPTNDRRNWAYVGRNDEAPLRFLLFHLLYKVFQTNGALRHAGLDIDYGIQPYLDLDPADIGGWRGIYGEVLLPERK